MKMRTFGFHCFIKIFLYYIENKGQNNECLEQDVKMVRKLNEGNVMCKKIFILCIKLRTTCKFGYTLNRDDYKQQRWDHH